MKLDLSSTSIPTSTQWFKKSEACEEQPDLSTYKTLIADKEKLGYTSPKQCTYTKIKHSHLLEAKDGTQSTSAHQLILAEMNFIFNPLISTLVISRNKNGSTLLDLLI